VFLVGEDGTIIRTEADWLRRNLVRVRKLLVLGLAVILALGAVAVVGCGGGNEEAKAALGTALDKIEQDVTELTTKFTAGGTVADVKAAKDQYTGDWNAVVAAAKNVEGADVAAAEEAWAKVSDAIDAMPEDKPLMEAGMGVLTPVQDMMAVVTDMRKLVGDGEEK
jgi:hypothetical protein